MPRMAAEERQRRNWLVLRLAIAGVPYREIGARPDVQLSHQTVGDIVHKELQKGAKSPLYEMASTVYLERLENLLRAVWPRAISGDLKAVEAARRILSNEARFFRILEGAEPDWGDEDDLDELEAYRLRRRSDGPRVPADGVWEMPELPPAP